MANNEANGLRDAFGSFMTGVTVVTTCNGDGTPLGFTANSFSSVSLSPALLLVSIAKTSSNYKAFAEGTHFAINILSEEQRDISNTFARPSEDRFQHIEWQKSEQSNPILSGVSAWFDCSMHQVVDAGDHAILIGKIESFYSSGLAGLGFYRGGYFNPFKVATEVISSPKVLISAIIGHEDEILLEQNESGQWSIPQIESQEGGAEVALNKLFAQYQPEASANFIYSVYEGLECQSQHIAFLCSSPENSPKKGQYVPLNQIEKLDFADSAVASMLTRYSKENQLQAYGVYYGSFEKGTVRQTVTGEK